MPVKVVAAKLAPAIDEANAVGTLRSDESVVIRPEIAGRIAQFRFRHDFLKVATGKTVLVKPGEASE